MYVGLTQWRAIHSLKEDVFFRNYAYRVHLLQQQALLEHPPSVEYTASLATGVSGKEHAKEDSERTEVSYDDVLDEDEDWEAALEAEIARSDTEVLYEAKEDVEEVQMENSVNEKNGTKENA